jgi:lipopolysaccharide export system permease protein
MLFFRTLSFLYLRYCVIVLVALSGFMLGFDMMNNGDELPKSANLLIIYGTYQSLYAIDMMLPISLVFAFIATLIGLVRSNALTSYYALGYSRFAVLAPMLYTTVFILILYIAAHMTSFARAHEYAENLRASSKVLVSVDNLFFTHEGSYIYFGTLNPLTQRASQIRIFTFKEGRLVESIQANEAYYQNHYWNMPNAVVIRSPKTLDLNGEGVERIRGQDIRVLKDFRPKILDQIVEGKVNYTILDALDALALLKGQNIDLSKIESSLYRNFVTPWFALMMIILIYAHVPIGSRFANLSLYGFGAILATLIVWGVLFMLGELSNNTTLTPLVGVIIPIVLLGLLSFIYLSQFWLKSRINSQQKKRA